MKLGIRGKLFVMSLTVISITVLVLNLYVSSELSAAIEDRIGRELSIRARLITHELEGREVPVDWQAAASELAHQALARVTLIDAKGTVLGDSEVDTANLGRLENHAGRPEVQQALAGGIGMGRRHSVSIHHDLLYVAVPLRAHGVEGAARLAQSLEPIESAVSRARELLLWGTLLAVVIAGAFSSVGASFLSRSLRDLRAAAERMAKDWTERTNVRGVDEVGALGQALDELADNLSRSLQGLERERDQLEAILQTIVEGVLVTDAEGRIVMTNQALRTMLGNAGRIIGRAPIESIRNADLAEIITTVSRTHAVRSAELEIAGIVPRTFRVQAAPLSGVGQRGVVAVFSDLTELRRLESIRRDFVANVSHELRTPIAAVLAAAETLESGALRDPVSAESFVQIIARHAHRLREIVEDLLALSRIESQKLDLTPEPIPVRELFEYLVDSYSVPAARQNTSLVIEVAPSAATFVADRGALEQILSNLVDNAVKYAPRSTITLGAVAAEDEMRLFVRDTGPGIPTQHLSRIFERFYRVDKGRSREVGGTGLGLSIVKHLSEALGGHVSVESTVGEGSQFTVHLPSAPAMSRQPAPASSHEANSESRNEPRSDAPIPYQP